MTTTMTSLRDALSFPSFASCPYEHIKSEPYFLIPDDGVYGPARHWCFLGEITDTVTQIRLRLWVQDKAGESAIPIAFHLDRDRPMFRLIEPEEVEVKMDHPNVALPLVRKGNTIAVLYAQRHPFFDGTTGLRIEDADFVQVHDQLECATVDFFF
jgi:hypothetical protein